MSKESEKKGIEASFKSMDTEEFLDIYFNRPIGYAWALFFKKLKVHPNVVTILSIILGVGAGVMFYYPDMKHTVIGILLLMMATKNGLVKKTPIKEYANVRKNGLAAITLRDDDELIEVKLTDDKKDIILVTKDGMCIRFKETDVRSTGRTSMGVRGMNIDDGDEVVAMQLNSQGDCLLIVSANGMGKRTSMGEFTCQNRGGKGVKCYKITEKTGDVIGARAVNEDNEVMLITTEGIIIRIACADISILGRITSGVKLINLTEGVTVASVAKVRDKEEKDTNAQQAAVEITDSAETEESDQPTDQETQDENRGEEE